MKRGVDEVEEFYYALAKLYEGSSRMFFLITGHLSVQVDVHNSESREQVHARLDEALRKAWLTLRFHQPTIASRVVRDAETGKLTKVYRTLRDDSEQKTWLENTLIPVSTKLTGNEWANTDPPAPKLPTLFVINASPSSDNDGPVRRDLVLRSPHDIIDGIGTLQLLDRLVDYVSKAFDEGNYYRVPTLNGSETSRLSPPFRVAADVPFTLNETQKKKLASIAAQKEAAAKIDGNLLVLGLPFWHGAVLPGKHQRVGLSLSKEHTFRLLAACKSVGITVTHAFHAAIAMVLRDVQDRNVKAPRVRYVSYILRNERARCKLPYNTPDYAASVYHSVSGGALIVDMDFPGPSQESTRKDEFLQIVQTVRDYYEEARNDQEHCALAPFIWQDSIPRIPATGTVPPVPPPKQHPSVSISSMGCVDYIIKPDRGRIRVYDPWVTGEELGNGLGLFLGTYRGELCLSSAYNDAWQSHDGAMDFLKRCMAAVSVGLGVFDV
ncbi:hypothetical protein K449DRAFT_366732 [Hypoxylon sp. EC38]|nr:hypothetical protein K449DRAFT_366732 [Hypoxylon sp. EC38]